MKRQKVIGPMDAVYAARRRNLVTLIEQHDGTKNLGERLGYTSGSFLSQLIGDPPRRKLTEVTAREIESKLGLAAGWLDSVRAVPVADGA